MGLGPPPVVRLERALAHEDSVGKQIAGTAAAPPQDRQSLAFWACSNVRHCGGMTHGTAPRTGWSNPRTEPHKSRRTCQDGPGTRARGVATPMATAWVCSAFPCTKSDRQTSWDQFGSRGFGEWLVRRQWCLLASRVAADHQSTTCG
jgi:hypothetical protein